MWKVRPVTCRARHALVLASLAACESSVDNLYSPPSDDPYYTTVASCPVYEDGKLVGADIVFYYDDPKGAPPEVADFVDFVHDREETEGFVSEPGLLLEMEGGESVVVRPQAIGLERHSMFENAGVNALVYARDLGEPGPLWRTYPILRAFYAPQPIHVGGVVFSEAVVRVQPVTSQIDAVLDLLSPHLPEDAQALGAPRKLGYRDAISRAIGLLGDQERPGVIMLDTGHRIFPDPERPPLHVAAGPLPDDDMAAMADELAAAGTTLIVIHQLGEDPEPRMNMIEPDLQQLACQSGGFLIPATAIYAPHLWSENAFELSWLSYWRLRVTWPPVDAQPGVVGGWVVNDRAVSALGQVHLSAAWRRME